MLGQLINCLDNPAVALRFVAALDDPSLRKRLAAASRAEGRPAGEVVAAALHGFLDTASDDHWLQLVGIMNRAQDPGLATVRAILGYALPAAKEG